VVRTLGTDEPMQIVRVGSSSNYNYYRNFYWDRRNDGGAFVPSGTYTVYISAQSGSGVEAIKEVQIEVRSSQGETEEQTEPQSEGQSDAQTESQSETQAAPQTEEQSGNQTNTDQEVVKASSVYAMTGTKKITKAVIGKKEKLQITPVVLPSNTTNKSVTYSSSNTKVATVNSKGIIKGKKIGTAEITVKTGNGKKAVIKIRVKKAPKKIWLKTNSKKLKKAKAYNIKVLMSLKTASYGITYKSNNNKVATVDASGKVFAGRKGKATITVKTFNGKITRLKITVS